MKLVRTQTKGGRYKPITIAESEFTSMGVQPIGFNTALITLNLYSDNGEIFELQIPHHEFEKITGYYNRLTTKYMTLQG